MILTTILKRECLRLHRSGYSCTSYKVGAFVQLEPDLDALCHVSQISSRRLEKPEDALSVGQVVQAKVIKIEPEARRISISIKEVAPIDPELPEEEAAEEAPVEEAPAEAPETTEEA